VGDELRRPWTEGPDEEAPPESWLLLDDDALLHRIQTLGAAENEDERLLEVVESDRHFFIRQEAAKRVRSRDRLFDFEDDRHVGQILVRHLTRREDVTYLERLSARSTHVEVRSAAQVQLARLWRKLNEAGSRETSAGEARNEAGGLGGGLGAPQSPSPSPAPPSMAVPSSGPASPSFPSPPAPPASVVAAPAPSPASPALRPSALAATPAPAPPPSVAPTPSPAPAAPPEPVTSAPLEKGGVDGSLLAWAAHFLIEPSWSRLGTKGTRELLATTRRELLGRQQLLVYFEVSPDARVTTNLDGGPRLPRDTVKALAAWMVAYRAAVRAMAPELELSSIRAATATMADALRAVGFYAACDAAEGKPGKR